MGFSINRDTSKASSIGSVRCKASDRSNTCCLTRSDNEADDRTNRGFAVKEVYRGSLKENVKNGKNLTVITDPASQLKEIFQISMCEVLRELFEFTNKNP